jgi:hypothetical protein
MVKSLIEMEKEERKEYTTWLVKVMKLVFCCSGTTYEDGVGEDCQSMDRNNEDLIKEGKERGWI